jgi:translation initiation factor IF-1
LDFYYKIEIKIRIILHLILLQRIMVKNTTGGSKHKGMARKLVNAPISNKIRFSEDDDECYARVVKMLGNGMCHVNLLHKDIICENVVCHIRGKFRSRNKKNNLVSVGSVLLVGIPKLTTVTFFIFIMTIKSLLFIFLPL